MNNDFIKINDINGIYINKNIKANYVLHIPFINQIIYNYLNFEEQLKVKYLNKICSSLNIMNIKDLPSRLLYKLTDEILYRYPFCEKLNVTFNTNISNINHMKNLIELDCENCGINDNGIKDLYNLKNLKASYNKNITNINHMKNLIELEARDASGELYNLQMLNFSFNKNIKDINHMENLIHIFS